MYVFNDSGKELILCGSKLPFCGITRASERLSNYAEFIRKKSTGEVKAFDDLNYAKAYRSFIVHNRKITLDQIVREDLKAIVLRHISDCRLTTAAKWFKAIECRVNLDRVRETNELKLAKEMFDKMFGMNEPEPKGEEPVAEKAPVEEPKVEEPVVEEPKAEEAPVEEPVAEPVAEEAPVEEPKVEEPVAEEPKAEEAPVEEPVAEETLVEEAPIEEAPVEEPVAEEAPVEEAPKASKKKKSKK